MNLTKEKAIEILKTVQDPEIQMDIYTLGLIYDIKINANKEIELKMTLTSPTCPYGPALLNSTKASLKKAGFNNPKINLVFIPPWQPSEEVKIMLGIQ